MPPVIAILLAAHALVIAATLRAPLVGSRRLLAVVLVTLLPGAGALLVLLVHRVQGGGIALEDEAPPAPPRALSAADARRLADLPPLLDRLTSTDPAERLAALICVTSGTSVDGPNVLRWAVEHGAPDVVLDAALTLEALELGREVRLGDTRAALAACPTYAHAVAAADAAALSVLNGTADGAAVATLAEQARASYDLALSLEPTRSDEVHERVARLELAALRPVEALVCLGRLSTMATSITGGLRQLRDDVAFAARRFELVSAELLVPAHTPERPAPVAVVAVAA